MGYSRQLHGHLTGQTPNISKELQVVHVMKEPRRFLDAFGIPIISVYVDSCLRNPFFCTRLDQKSHDD